MASNSNQNNRPITDTEPLLGAPGDVTQRPWEGFYWNIITGTAAVAQGGIWVLAAIVWASIFEHDLIFFSVHPLVNTAALLLLVQGILVLQPTSTQKQKILGTYIHSVFNVLALGSFVAGLIVIEMNKASHPETRFQSIHGKIGLIMYILIFIQVIVGILQFYIPAALGGVDRAKSIYKYHRMSGYTILGLGLATVCLAALTTYNETSLHIKLWTLVTTSVLVVVGVLPRVKKAKFGF